MTSNEIYQCWFCGTRNTVLKDDSTNEYVISCANCKNNGLTVEARDKDKKTCILKWNKARQILTNEDLENIVKHIDQTKITYDLLYKLRHIVWYSTDYSERIGYGGLIDMTGKYIECKEPHEIEMLKYYGFDYSNMLLVKNSNDQNNVLANGLREKFIIIHFYVNIVDVDLNIHTYESVKTLIEWINNFNQFDVVSWRIEEKIFVDKKETINYLFKFLK